MRTTLLALLVCMPTLSHGELRACKILDVQEMLARQGGRVLVEPVSSRYRVQIDCNGDVLSAIFVDPTKRVAALAPGASVMANRTGNDLQITTRDGSKYTGRLLAEQ
jgi:hypothetical protein